VIASIHRCWNISHKLILVRLLDQLMLWFAWMLPYIQPYIADVYVDTFTDAYNNGYADGMETMKLMRKLWVGTLSPLCIEAIRTRIYSLLGLDVDFDFARRSIEVVVQHYSLRLRMPQEVVIQHA